MTKFFPRAVICVLTAILFAVGVGAQARQSPAIELGSQTAKNGFRNEDEIRDKFNAWKTDDDAKAWLAVMNYKFSDIASLSATKPHGEKADVEVRIRLVVPSRKDTKPTTTPSAPTKGVGTATPPLKGGELEERREGISIKLVSSPNGFNQIDKRWLSHYVKMWKMPADTEAALKLFLGENAPIGQTRKPDRMYLNELDAAAQKAVIDFFTINKAAIVSDLFSGDGPHAANWFMVAQRSKDKTRWILRTDKDAIKFFAEGSVELTRTGNLKIGRITMQRKGGDAGRDTAKMLQFKINPVLLFDAK